MSSPDSGGPAFPVPGQFVKSGDVAMSQPTEAGMSLRDWFAGMAMQRYVNVAGAALAASPDTDNGLSETIAKVSYRLADAMIAERKKSK